MGRGVSNVIYCRSSTREGREARKDARCIVLSKINRGRGGEGGIPWRAMVDCGNNIEDFDEVDINWHFLGVLVLVLAFGT